MNKTDVENAANGCWYCDKPPIVHRAMRITRIFCRAPKCPYWPDVNAPTPEEAVRKWNQAGEGD